MPEPINKLSGGLRSLLAGFTSGQKTITALALVALLVGGVFFTSWASKPSLVPLFSNLASADAAGITEELASRGTKYQLADGGSTILVPQTDVYQLRLDMAAAGMPTGGDTGYELLDKQGITTSEFRQRVDYQRALEGELAKTITAIDGVDATTVHLVIPEQTLFSEDSRQPSASVLVKNKPGKTMSANQIQAVVNLVSSSVEGLSPENVTLADAKGNVLSATGADGATIAAGDARASQTAAFETGLQQSVQEMLLPVVGAGKAVVRVKADLNFDKRETVTERFETEEEAPIVSESTSTEDYTGTGAVVGGVLGPENVAAPEGGESTYQKEQVSREYAVGKVTEQATAAPGAVERLSVAVLLDAEAAGAVNPAEIRQLVIAATGLDPERGDVVEVGRMAFDNAAAEAAEAEFAALAEAEKAAQRWSLIRTAAVLLVVGLLLLHALRVMRRDKRTPVVLPVSELEVSSQQLSLESEEAAALAAADRRSLDAPALSSANAQRMVVQNEIGDLVERQPEEVAQLLRGWLADRRS
jgi:flagellar M-ring protein FliF